MEDNPCLPSLAHLVLKGNGSAPRRQRLPMEPPEAEEEAEGPEAALTSQVHVRRARTPLAGAAAAAGAVVAQVSAEELVERGVQALESSHGGKLRPMDIPS